MKYLWQKLLTALIVIFVLASCTVASLSVISDYDAETDFSQYKSFYWSDDFQRENGSAEEQPLFYNTLIKKRLKTSIKRELLAKGYQIDRSDPDLLVNSRVIVEEKNVTREPYPYPYYYPYYYYGYSYPMTFGHKEGGVVIELIDKDKHQLVWQGYAPDVIRAETGNKQREIAEAVAKIFSAYSFRAGDNVSMR